MKNLFITRTPMQIINAFEAMQHFRCQHSVLLIIHNFQNNNAQQIYKVIESFSLNEKFEEIIEIKNSRKSKFFQALSLVKQLKKEHYNRVFLGSYGGVGKLLLANLSYKESYLIDDGIATIVAHKNITTHLNQTKIGFKELRSILFGLKVTIKTPINFFTIFNLEQVHNEIIIKHSFQYVKKSLPNPTQRDDTIYFLGQNLTEVNIVTKEKYLYYLKQILLKYHDKKIIYIPHRAEILHHEITQLASENFIIKQSTMPIELFFLLQGIYPKHIISFFSSALYTLNVLFSKSMVEAFHIESQDLENRVQNVILCQKFLQTTSIVQSPLKSYNDF
jgi:hypothetical protein